MASPPWLLDEASLIDCADEIAGGAVHHWRFGPVDFDQQVVDLQTEDRGEKVFDGADSGAGSVAEHSAERGIGHIGPLGLQQAFAPSWQTGAQKHDAGVRVRRMKDELGRRRGMNACASDRDPVA